MWPFGFGNKYPYTNFHELNLDWILDQIGHLTNSVKELYKKMEDFFIDTTPIIEDTVNTWLDDHPEATTTVQDGSITVEKFNESVVDATLTESGHPADAKAVGDLLFPAAGNLDKQLDDVTFIPGNGNPTIFACAASWLRNNDKLYYGNDSTCNSFIINEDGAPVPVWEPKSWTVLNNRYPMDCMTFVDMCLRGIGFEDSAYGNQTNWIRYPCMSIAWTSKAYAQYAYVDANTLAEKPLITVEDGNWTPTTVYKRVLTWQYARFLRDHDLYSPVKTTTTLKMMQMLQPGDILWFGDPTNPDFADQFEGIYHCAIFMGWNKDTPMIMDCTSIDPANPIMIRAATGAHSAARLRGYSRIPLGGRGQMGLDSGLDLRVNAGDFSGYAQNQDIIFLKTKSEKWNTYKFTVAYMYADIADAGNSFPSIYWDAAAVNINRFAANERQAYEAGKWYVGDIIVTLDDANAHFGTATITDVNDFFRAQFYPAPAGRTYIRCLKVEPVLLRESSQYTGDYVVLDRQSYEFDTYQEAAEYLQDNFLTKINNDYTLRFKFWSASIAGSGENLSGAIIKIRSDAYKVAVWNNTGYGCIINKKFGVTSPVITSYTSSDPFPYEVWMK